ncbi:MAG: hydroxymethylglutaryl-CoA synthase [Acidobacteriota bacterium]
MTQNHATSRPAPSNRPADTETGIASLGVALPSLYLELDDLADLRGADPAKYRFGLGCRQMALCDAEEGVVDLARRAARRALERWSGDVEDIGLIAVGTESAVDMSRPLSAWVAEDLGVRGAVRSYEVKHACYGGTLALRQAIEWRRSGAARGKAALVIAADVALYAPEDPGEPTQGAGAVAFVVAEPEVARVDLETAVFSEPAFDFWRPVGEDFPRVDGKFSLDCYKRATLECLAQWSGERTTVDALEALEAACFHVPFPKMVQKAVRHVGKEIGADEGWADDYFKRRIAPSMGWNQRVGNAYTASLWLSVAEALAGRADGDRLMAFSYGSGYGSELMGLEAGPRAADGAWREDVQRDLDGRRRLDVDGYRRLRSSTKKAA